MVPGLAGRPRGEVGRRIYDEVCYWLRVGKGRRIRQQRLVVKRGPFVAPVAKSPRAIEDRFVRFAGSDQKRSGYDSSGICWLCLGEAKLRLGHTLPRWSFQEIGLAEPGLAKAFRGTLDYNYESTDGDKHYFLCGPCEESLGADEARLKDLSLSTPSVLMKNGFGVAELEPGTFRIDGAGMRSIHRALLGIVYKLALASTSSVAIPSVRLEELRSAVLTGDLDAFAPPAAMKFYRSPASYDAEPWGSQGSVSGNYNEDFVVIVYLGGFDWRVPIGRRASDNAPSTLTVWPLFVRWVLHHHMGLDGLDELLVEWRAYLLDLPFESLCPCGSRVSFGKCCRHGWLEGLLALPAPDGS